jgi:hypothetical protein
MLVRVNHHLSIQQVRALRVLARRLGLPVAELIRRAVADYLVKEKKS